MNLPPADPVISFFPYYHQLCQGTRGAVNYPEGKSQWAKWDVYVRWEQLSSRHNLARQVPTLTVWPGRNLLPGLGDVVISGFVGLIVGLCVTC